MEHFRREAQEYVIKMVQMYNQGQLQSFVDLGEKSQGGKFTGLPGVMDAVDVSIEIIMLSLK